MTKLMCMCVFCIDYMHDKEMTSSTNYEVTEFFKNNYVVDRYYVLCKFSRFVVLLINQRLLVPPNPTNKQQCSANEGHNCTAMEGREGGYTALILVGMSEHFPDPPYRTHQKLI